MLHGRTDADNVVLIHNITTVYLFEGRVMVILHRIIIKWTRRRIGLFAEMFANGGSTYIIIL